MVQKAFIDYMLYTRNETGEKETHLRYISDVEPKEICYRLDFRKDFSKISGLKYGLKIILVSDRKRA